MDYELLTIRDVAKTVRLNVSSIYRLVRLKQFPAGKKWVLLRFAGGPASFVRGWIRGQNL